MNDRLLDALASIFAREGVRLANDESDEQRDDIAVGDGLFAVVHETFCTLDNIKCYRTHEYRCASCFAHELHDARAISSDELAQLEKRIARLIYTNDVTSKQRTVEL